MTLRRTAGLAAGFGLLTVAFGGLLAMCGLLLTGLSVDTPAGVGLLILGGNLTLVSAIAGLYLLDSPADRTGAGIRNLTLAGWGLVAIAANVTAGVAIGLGQAPETAWLLYLRKISIAAGAIVGGAVFLIGWFILSRFGLRVWRSTGGPS